MVALRVADVLVFLLSSPLVAFWSEFVRRQRTRTGSEGTRDHDGFFAVPGGVLLQDLRVFGAILRRQVWRFVRLRVYPP